MYIYIHINNIEVKTLSWESRAGLRGSHVAQVYTI